MMHPPRAGLKLPEIIKRQRRFTDAVYSFSETLISTGRVLEFIIKEIRTCKCPGRDEAEAENGRGCNKIPIQKLVENGI